MMKSVTMLTTQFFILRLFGFPNCFKNLKNDLYNEPTVDPKWSKNGLMLFFD